MLSKEERSEILLSNIGGADCAVVALQAAIGLSRPEAVKLAKEHGWKEDGDDAGMYTHSIIEALRATGRKITRLRLDQHSQTAAVFALQHEYGTFVIFTPGHVAALVDGNLYNSRSSWSAEVEEAVSVEDAL